MRLLLVVTAVAVLFGLWTQGRIADIRRRNRAVELVVSLGGTVSYDYQWGATGWREGAVAPGSSWEKYIFGENYASEVVEVQLFKEAGARPELFTDSEAELLAALSGLKWLVLMDTAITDRGLRHFARLKQLQRLDLEGTHVTDRGVRELKRALPGVKIYH